MMMALSNKSKRSLLLPGTVKEAELSANQVLPSNVANSAFDMEKYLKKTVEIGHESEYESVVKDEASVQSLMRDTFLLGEDKNKDILAEDLINNHSKQQETEKRFLSYFNEENDIQRFSSLSGVPSHAEVIGNSVKYSEKSDVVNTKHLQFVNADLRSDMLDTRTSPTGNEAQTHGIPVATSMEAAQRRPLAYQSDDLASRCSIRKDTGTGDQATNAAPESCRDLLERSTGNTLSLSNLKSAKRSSKCVLVSPTKAKLTEELSNDEEEQSAKQEKTKKDASAAHSGNEKRVTFEKRSLPPQPGTGSKRL